MEKLTPILQIAYEILQDAGQKGLHTKEIAEIAVSQNKNMGLNVEDFQKKVQISLAANLKLKSTAPTFAPVTHKNGSRKGNPKQGCFRLKIKRSPTPPASPLTPPDSPKLTSFAGKAGEYAVMSELLFWGFNPSIMTVDDGIDIVASKDGQFFLLQVKTAQQGTNEKYSFAIKKSSYKRYTSNNVFYIFVLRHRCKNEFIVIPNQQIEYFINTGKITSNSDRLSFYISYDTKKKGYLLNGQADVQPYFGNFGVIR